MRATATTQPRSLLLGHGDPARPGTGRRHTGAQGGTAMPGSEDFARLTDPFRAELLAHCYRMLGSVHDAEDQLQETLIRAWRSYGEFEGRASLRTWLYRIATNACLRALENRDRRPLPSGLGGPGEDPAEALAAARTDVPWLQPIPDALFGGAPADPAAIVASRTSMRLALIAALQYLPARQRAVLILRDVLGFSARETAEALGTTSACPCPRSRAGTRAATQSASSSVCGLSPHSSTSGSPPSPPAGSRLSPPTSGTRR